MASILSSREVVFVVKLSKFCNLRCSYCYEHRELHVRDIMRAEILERLFIETDRLGEHLVRLGIVPNFFFVWHGGEPLLLAADFYRNIAEMQRRHISKFAYRNGVQSNLHGVNQEALAFVLDSDWDLGISIDFADGARVNAGGRCSNASVISAAERLRASGGRFGVISVLGTHNRDALPHAYDWVARTAESWRILPVFTGGPEDGISRLRLPEEDVVRVFLEIFERRANSPMHIPVAPLDEYVKGAALKIAGERAVGGDVSRELLDNIFIVNVNGDVFTRPFAYDDAFCVGNIGRESVVEMVAGETYRSCQAAIRLRKARNCVHCDFGGFCDSSPMHEHGSVDGDGRCLVHRRAIGEVEAALRGAGVDRAVIAEWARESLATGSGMPVGV
jgi:uncharacterized protein